MPAAAFDVTRRTLLAGLGALATAACSKLVFVAANVPAAFGAYRRHADVSFGSGAHHALDVYVPDRPAATPRPLVVFWYGGRWTTGDKDDYKFVGAALAGLGYVAVLPNYRHYPDVKLAGFMDDAARAASWAVQHGAEFGADPQQLYLMGHSSGAHMAALVTVDPRYFLAIGRAVPHIAGVIGLSGPYDFLPLTDDDTKDMFAPPEQYPDSQPIHFVRRAPPGTSFPRMLLIHGAADETVLPKNSINFAAALRERGTAITLQLYPKLGHADTVAAMSIPARGRAPTMGDIAAFVVSPPRSS